MDAIADIEGFTDGIDFETFRVNREKILAVVKSIEILGEAVKRIPDEIRSQNPQIPWKALAGMRDVLLHEYWGIDANVV
ncbi:MAG: HepT-like ribonuclease domain-containing protein [Brasilonema sp.]